MQKVLQDLETFAPIPRPILIRGERGTGKELVARHLHKISPRSDKSFLPVNCAAFNDQLVGAEFFGYKKGAFTGADQDQQGKLKEADGGFLFLDELGNMSLNTQELFLRVFEYKTFTPIGSHKEETVDVRFISATNAELEKLIDEGGFRADLFDRLRFAEIELPPLRKRREDIPSLILFFIEGLRKEIPNLAQKHFTPKAIEILQDYHWPGNIRELKNVVERCYCYCQDEVITREFLPNEMTGRILKGDSFNDKVEEFKKRLIIDALEEHDHQQTKAAESLKMTYDQFRHQYRSLFQ